MSRFTSSLFRIQSLSKLNIVNTTPRFVNYSTAKATIDPKSTEIGDPWHGSYHWLYERALSVGCLVTTGAAFVAPPSKAIDFLITILFPLHCHIGFGAVITDYLPQRKFPRIYPVARGSLIAATIGTIYGLYLYNTRDIGITETMYQLFSEPQGEANE